MFALSLEPEFNQEGVFVVQNKVASATPQSLNRTDKRRAASIEKNILAAIKQLKGAIRRLKSGDPIFRPDGTPFEPRDLKQRVENGGHGIVLISDMYEGVDWKKIADELIEGSGKTGYLFHALDLRELQRLVTFSDDRPALLEYHLIRRFQLMGKERSALIRSQMELNS